MYREQSSKSESKCSDHTINRTMNLILCPGVCKCSSNFKAGNNYFDFDSDFNLSLIISDNEKKNMENIRKGLADTMIDGKKQSIDQFDHAIHGYPNPMC